VFSTVLPRYLLTIKPVDEEREGLGVVLLREIYSAVTLLKTAGECFAEEWRILADECFVDREFLPLLSDVDRNEFASKASAKINQLRALSHNEDVFQEMAYAARSFCGAILALAFTFGLDDSRVVPLELVCSVSFNIREIIGYA
jgi:hypothetical protein